MTWKAAARMLSAQLMIIGGVWLFSSTASATVRISEIYWDPPEGLDTKYEYIELSGDPNTSLTNYYLIFLENELSDTANPGVVENIFDLGALSVPKLGSNGFLTLRQGGTNYAPSAVGTTDLKNTKAPFTWGSGATSSSVGHQDADDDGVIENSGWTAILLKNNGGEATKPTITPVIDLDEDDNNELDAAKIVNWTLFDRIGVVGEESEAESLLYGLINFGPLPDDGFPNTPAGTAFVETPFELEYVARWGNSTGFSPADWHAANPTNNPASGPISDGVFRQSGLLHDGPPIQDGLVETTQGVPYGTELLNTRGSQNLHYRDGDFDFDNDVDGFDFLIWQRNYGYSYTNGAYLGDGVANDATRNHGDANLDRQVTSADLVIWESLYGSAPSLSAAISSVPEPSTLLLAGTLVFLSGWRSREK